MFDISHSAIIGALLTPPTDPIDNAHECSELIPSHCNLTVSNLDNNSNRLIQSTISVWLAKKQP